MRDARQQPKTHGCAWASCARRLGGERGSLYIEYLLVTLGIALAGAVALQAAGVPLAINYEYQTFLIFHPTP